MKILSTILYTIFVTSIVGMAGLFVVSLLPIPGNIQIKVVKSGSMEPAIHTGAIVAVIPSANYSVGDVITFGEDTGKKIPTTHRIIAMQGEGSATIYTTQGDANEDPDAQPVTRSEVIGKVLFTIPAAGYVLDFARKPLGFTLMIGIPAGIIILDELMRIFTEVKKIRTSTSPSPIARRKVDEEDTLPETSNASTRVLDLRRL
jgi:signal peptidase